MHAALLAPERHGPAFAKMPEAIATTPATAGAAYFYVNDVGLVTIGADGAVSQQKLPIQGVSALAIDRDGAVIVAAKHVFRVKDAAVEQLGGDDSPDGSYSAKLRVAPDGKVWLSTTSDFYAWDGKTWTKHANPLGESVTDFVLDGKGRVYAASNPAITMFDGAWQKVYDITGSPTQGYISQPKLWGVYIAGKELVAPYADGFIRLNGSGVQVVERKAGDPSLGDGRVVGSDYVSVFSGTDKHIIRTPIAGGADKVIELKQGPSTFAIDDGGRVWMASDAGVQIAAADGTITTWPVGSIPEISASISAIAVTGSGPSKLPAAGAIAKGTIRGHVTNKHAPVAKAYVEVCTSPRDSVRKDMTPCQNNPIHGSADTDDAGAFAIADLPLQDYKVVIRNGSDWYQLLGSQCAGMSDGATCDIGELDLSNKPFEYPH
jgi:hypothetical protein